MDKFLAAEVGQRSEVTTDMVARADYKRRMSFYSSDINYQYYLQLQLAQQQSLYMNRLHTSPISTGLSDFGGAAASASVLGFYSKCPYCGK